MLRIGLASVSFRNNDLDGNLNTIKTWLTQTRIQQLDLLLFGESFLQGFDSLTWRPETDAQIAIHKSGQAIFDLQGSCRRFGVGL